MKESHFICFILGTTGMFLISSYDEIYMRIMGIIAMLSGVVLSIIFDQNNNYAISGENDGRK